MDAGGIEPQFTVPDGPEVLISMSRSEMLQLRFAASIALAPGIEQPVFRTYLEVTDHI